MWFVSKYSCKSKTSFLGGLGEVVYDVFVDDTGGCAGVAVAVAESELRGGSRGASAVDGGLVESGGGVTAISAGIEGVLVVGVKDDLRISGEMDGEILQEDLEGGGVGDGHAIVVAEVPGIEDGAGIGALGDIADGTCQVGNVGDVSGAGESREVARVNDAFF